MRRRKRKAKSKRLGGLASYDVNVIRLCDGTTMVGAGKSEGRKQVEQSERRNKRAWRNYMGRFVYNSWLVATARVQCKATRRLLFTQFS